MESEAVIPSIEYAGSQPIEPLPPLFKSRLFWFVVCCWFVPMVIGVTIGVLARCNRPYQTQNRYWSDDAGGRPKPNAADVRRDGLEAAGVVDLLFGVVATLSGLCAVVAFFVGRSRPAPNRIRGLLIPLLGMLFLLGTNFVLAGVVIAWVGN